ncbi:YfiR family protein [uncultured Marivirga sp.]|uniref:YfiR family protein n=1 Tax=uncultured Marivirga sp. TaxID=1123707 RepID=UPI0030EE3D75|tara:strand:- start:25776 stop:26300 length:525 start_codon:yes stop_codon:yes gene_type:complete
MKRTFKIFIIAFCVSIGFNSLNVNAQRPMHEIHTMLIFNFIKYVEWPSETKSGDFVIAVYGDDDVYNQLFKLYGQREIKGQNTNIVNVSDVAQMGAAHVLYVASNKSKDFEDILGKYDTKPTLIITDKPGLGKKGSSINFREAGGKLKFEINQATFDNSNLKVSSQLVNMGIAI